MVTVTDQFGDPSATVTFLICPACFTGQQTGHPSSVGKAAASPRCWQLDTHGDSQIHVHIDDRTILTGRFLMLKQLKYLIKTINVPVERRRRQACFREALNGYQGNVRHIPNVVQVKKPWECAYIQACEYCVCTNSRCLPSSPLDGYRPVQDQSIHGSKAPSAFHRSS